MCMYGSDTLEILEMICLDHLTHFFKYYRANKLKSSEETGEETCQRHHTSDKNTVGIVTSSSSSS